MPRMPLSGVRTSCETIARKRDFARLAVSAWSRASASARSACTRSVTSRPTLCSSAPGSPPDAHHHLAPGDPARAGLGGDLLVVDAGAVGGMRGGALLEHRQREGGAEQRLARPVGERAERVVDIGDAPVGVAAHDHVALRGQKTLGALFRFLELPIAVGQLLGALLQRAQLAPERCACARTASRGRRRPRRTARPRRSRTCADRSSRAGLRIVARKPNAAANDIDRMTAPRTMADRIRRP